MSLLETLEKIGAELYREAEAETRSEVEYNEEEGYYLWNTPPLRIDQEKENEGRPFSVLFQDSSIIEADDVYSIKYLTAALFLIGGITGDGLRVISPGKSLYQELNTCNVSEPGVKFQYLEYQYEDGIMPWVVVQEDIRLNEDGSLSEGALKDALRRLLACAEFHYQTFEVLAEKDELRQLVRLNYEAI